MIIPSRTLRCLTLCAAAFCATVSLHAQAIEALPKNVAQALKAANIPSTHIAVVVQEIGSRTPRLALNAEQAMNPASVMKLVTTYAGLEILGPAYTWRTEARSTNLPTKGILNSDLFLKGSGDPRLTFEQFWLLLRQLRAQGVQDIRGNLVLDRSALAPAFDNAQFDEQPLRAYNVTPDALLLNWKAIRLQIGLDEDGKSLRINSEPAPANLEISNLITLDDTACGEWKDRLRADVVEHSGGRFRLVLTGAYARSCGTQTWALGVLDHANYVVGVFRQLWQELGGSFSGEVRNGIMPESAKLLGSIESPPLAEVIRDINKFSNNVMARQLFLSIGGKGPTEADRAVRNWLQSKELRMPELVLENGSGLSRNERLSAESLNLLLQAAWKSPLMPEFVASLPIAGVDGTMKKRLRQSTASGQAHLKTGTLEGVKSLAGYVRDKAGKWYVVVFLINDPNAANGQAAQDALVQWVVDR